MEYLEKVLGIRVIRSKWHEENKLPYYLVDKYCFELATMDGITVLIVKPKGELDTINAIQKHISRLNGVISCPVVFELNEITRQRKKSFINARIPFVVPEKQIYLPFMGMLLVEKCDGGQNLPVSRKLQPSAQMLLFAFLRGKGAPMQMSRMAEQLLFSAMTISRAAGQLTEAGLLQKKLMGNQKLLVSDLTIEELFQKAEPFLLDPVKKTIYISKDKKRKDMFSAGLTALAEQTMLNPPVLETLGCVCSEKEFLDRSSQLIDTEMQCAVQLWRYDPRLISQNDRIDAFSLATSLKDGADERVEQCIEELLEREWR